MLHISVRETDNVILQFGQSIGDMEGCRTETVDDSFLDTFQQPGIKTLEADGSIAVSPDLAAQAAEQARLDAIAAAEAQRLQDAKNVENLFPNATPDEIASFLRLAGISS